jgi:putative radical SAM enzyme (TIGR03279 family)
MSAPKVTAVAENSPAATAGIQVGDELVVVNGRAPRDVIEYHQLVDDEEVTLEVRRPTASTPVTLSVRKDAGAPMGVSVSSPVFDRIRTCDNRCPFCFIHQLPKNMRKSLYVRDDDYRLSFLYGNFTTLTRFTELDAERVVSEALSPLFVSIHATDPHVRTQLLKNPKGATSLRWLSFLLDAGIEVHGQIVVCPGINDGMVLEDTLCTILDRYSKLASVAIVPLGISQFNDDETMIAHTRDDARRVIETVNQWQGTFSELLGRKLAYASDEYYLLADYPIPGGESYEEFAQHENGVGMIAAFREAFFGKTESALGIEKGFFASVDGAPAAGYRAPRATLDEIDGYERQTTILTGTYAAPILEELVVPYGVSVMAVENRFFGGTIAVAGLLTGADIAHALRGADPSKRYLLPDACLSEGRFLDGLTPNDLPVAVTVIGSDGWSLRQAVDPALAQNVGTR